MSAASGHRRLCADATKWDLSGSSWVAELAEMIFTDPPYNVPIDGHVSGLGSVKHREFAMADGEMTEAEFIAFLEIVLGSMAAHSREGAIAFVCMDWRHLFELLTVGRRVYSELKNPLCVDQDQRRHGIALPLPARARRGLQEGFGRTHHNVELGRHGRYRTNVWAYAGMNGFGPDRDGRLVFTPR